MKPVAPRFRMAGRVPRSAPLIAYHCARWGYMRAAKADAKFVNSTHKVFRFQGALDIKALEKSLALLVARQRILAAHVADGPKGPCYRFDGPAPRLETFDLSRRPAARRIAEARRLASKTVWQVFPDEGPWLRLFTIRLSARDHVIGLVLHHFIADGVSVSIAAGELMAGYFAFAAGRQPAPPPLPLQYTDYAAGLNDWLRRGDTAGHEAFWRRQLAGAPATRLPPDKKPRPEEPSAAATVDFRLPRALTGKIRRATAGNSIAMGTLVLAAAALALARHGASRDVVFQAGVSGRTDLRLSRLIGAFNDVVALRFRLPETGALADFLGQARSVVMAGYAHQVFSYHLVKPLLAGIGASDVPTIVNFFSYFDAGAPRAKTGLKPFPLEPAPTACHQAGELTSIVLRVVHDATGISGTVEYLTAHYRRPTVRRFAESFGRALEAMVCEPDRPVAKLLAPRHRRNRRL